MSPAVDEMLMIAPPPAALSSGTARGAAEGTAPSQIDRRRSAASRQDRGSRSGPWGPRPGVVDQDIEDRRRSARSPRTWQRPHPRARRQSGSRRAPDARLSVAASASASMSQIHTRAPWARKEAAIARPIPAPPAVTSTRLPAIPRISLLPCCSAGRRGASPTPPRAPGRGRRSDPPGARRRPTGGSSPA